MLIFAKGRGILRVDLPQRHGDTEVLKDESLNSVFDEGNVEVNE